MCSPPELPGAEVLGSLLPGEGLIIDQTGPEPVSFTQGSYAAHTVKWKDESTG
jgi:hypothetical protein